MADEEASGRGRKHPQKRKPDKIASPAYVKGAIRSRRLYWKTYANGIAYLGLHEVGNAMLPTFTARPAQTSPGTTKEKNT